MAATENYEFIRDLATDNEVPAFYVHLPLRYEAREHFAQQQRTERNAQILWFWVLEVDEFALEAQVDGGDAGAHRVGGAHGAR